MATYISHSAAETAKLGETWGREAQRGLLIGLSGDLGAGKTELVKGIARGLGVTDRVQSPTFALVKTYIGGRLPLHHLDLYRLDTADQIMAAGLEEYLRPDGVTVIEWIEKWFDPRLQHAIRETQYAPAMTRLYVKIEEIGPTDRHITYGYENPGA